MASFASAISLPLPRGHPRGVFLLRSPDVFTDQRVDRTLFGWNVPACA